MQTIHKLEFDCDYVPYILHGKRTPETDQIMGLNAHVAQETKSKFWGIVFECFAQHCQAISKSLKLSNFKIVIVHFADPDDLCPYCIDSHYVLPDHVFCAFEDMKRTSAEDCAKMNWYLYQCAKDAVIERCAQEQIEDKCSELIDIEWETINQIINRQYVLAYPRPSDDRLGYLQENGIELALQLVK
jgi:hypothetical protein